ncbi:hypothetical protein DD238_003004 [Peronospora effusa]|uniref:Uncharacterized protein n=1 Tax=Peronospora effusa TaxID=542832 RepID=A0A3M6VKB3_9STRA|nr:hypothetical protein DD238_003004 [Peronospora effusa]
MQLLTLIATGATFLALLRTVQGHAYVVDPKANWGPPGFASNGYGSTINSTRWSDLNGVATQDYSQTAFFKRVFESTKAKNLGAFIARYQELYSSKIDVECGLTFFKESDRSELPAKEITYTGFTHPGPCEMWCDDTKLLFDYDCQKTYPDIPAKIPYDKSKCANANRFTIFWIAVQSNPLQVYVHCVWLVGGSGRGEPPAAVGKGTLTTTTGSNAPSPTPTINTAPSTTEVTPKADSDGSGDKPSASTPDATPDAPATESTTPETSTPETSTPETFTSKASTPKASSPDASTPDATPEASTPDAIPEASTPDATPDATPESSTPNATPESSTPNATPESSTPNATPEVSTPNATPEASTPDANQDAPATEAPTTTTHAKCSRRRRN